MGIIESKHGGGTYVSKTDMSVFNPLAIQFYLEDGKALDILELRYMLEVQLSAFAAKKATEKDLYHLENILNCMKNVSIVEERLSLNNEFLIAIAKISGNILINSIFKAYHH